MKIKHLSLAALCAFFAACSDSNSTSTDQHEHFEAEGWNLYWPDWKLAYSVYQGKEDKSLEALRVNANCLSEHITVKFLDDEKKEVSAPKDDEHTLGWSIGDESILDIEACGSWGFHLKGRTLPARWTVTNTSASSGNSSTYSPTARKNLP